MQIRPSAFVKFGVINGSIYLLNRVLRSLTGSRAFLQRYYLVAQPLDHAPRLPRKLGAELDIRLVTSGDPAVRDFPRPPEVVAARFRQGSICLAAYRGEEFVAFLWFTLGPYEEDEVRCRYLPLPAGTSAWDFDLYVEPRFRNGIAFAKLWAAAMEFLRQRDIRCSFSRISVFSPESLAAHRRLGATVIGQAFFLCLGGLQLMISSIRPYLRLSLPGSAGPILRVSVPAERVITRGFPPAPDD